MSGSVAWVRSPAAAMGVACELTYLRRSSIDPKLALRQHGQYVATLRAAHLEVIVLPALEDHPDCAFIEDTAICLPELVIQARPGAATRRNEVASAVEAIGAGRDVHVLASPGTLEGGDVLAVGKTLYVGRSPRTNAEGIRQLRQIVERHGYRVVPIPVTGALHLKTAVTCLAPDLFIANRTWFDADPFGQVTWIDVDPDEPFAGNTLTAGDVVIVPEAHERAVESIGHAGIPVRTVYISEFAKAEGGLTCLSVIERRGGVL